MNISSNSKYNLSDYQFRSCARHVFRDNGMRVIFSFQTEDGRNAFINRIQESGVFVSPRTYINDGFTNYRFYNGFYEVELEPSYIKDGNALVRIAGLCGGKINH